jgi:hypothetical protein
MGSIFAVRLCAVPARSFTEADQQIAAAIGERKRVEKRSY